MLPKLRHYTNPNSVITFPHVFKQRNIKNGNEVSLKYDEDGKPSLYMSLDMIDVHGKNNIQPIQNKQCSIMLADVRDHRVASECLPDGTSGYWVRIFGNQQKYTFHMSLWKDISESSLKYDKRKFHSPPNEKLMKIGELSVDLLNTGTEKKVKRRKCKKRPAGIPPCKLVKGNLEASDRIPSFCTKEKYVEIVNNLRVLVENGDYESFQKVFKMFKTENKAASIERDEKETLLFLLTEKSQMLSMQGDTLSKKLLQKVVDKVISKSPNKVFLLNRAYIYLANAHVTEQNYGTAEECLNVIQFDKKNGMAYEDIGLFYYLYAVIVMNYGTTIESFSNQLWIECEMFLHKAIKNFEKCSWTVNRLYRARLNLARLNIWKVRNAKEDFNFIEEELKKINESSDKLTKCNHCFLNIVYAELSYSMNQRCHGDERLENAQNIATEYNFRYELHLIDCVRKWWTDSQYNEFLNVIEKKEGANEIEEIQVFNISNNEDYFAGSSS